MRNIIAITVVPVLSESGVSGYSASVFKAGRLVASATGWDASGALVDAVARYRMARYATKRPAPM
jgi:hypothetical protein